MKKFCIICKKPFTRPNIHELRKAKCCSRKCSIENFKKYPGNPKKEKVKKVCPICNKEFYTFPAYKDTAKYCSYTCKHKGQSITTRGRKYVEQHKSAASFRNNIRKQFSPECITCGWNKDTCDVCHIVPRKKGGEDIIENILILCPNCHRLYDKGKLDLTQTPKQSTLHI